MLLMMVATLYTSRVVLAALGVEDYGIYNVVGGVVAMFSSISTTLSTAISRFITFELGRGNQKQLNKIFSTALIIQFVTSIILVVIIESVGLWFLQNKMVIPADRINAAVWVLHLSTLALVIHIISIPYNAAIVAHEKMSAFAYISILDAMGKLAIAYLITQSPMDKLIFYAILMCGVAFVVRIVYGVYCSRHFEECKKVKLSFDRVLFKEMFAFAAWNFIGTTSGVFRDQGGNILLNLFGGPAVNAARGVAMQVNNAVTGFSANFMTALNPQITKSYASGKNDYMMTLVFQGARLSFYMLLLLSLPIIISTPYLLNLWLKEVPNYTVIFVQLVLVFGMCDAISKPLITAMFATGNIKNYQIAVGSITILNLPISYVLLSLGYPPFMIFVVSIFLTLVALFVRLYMLRGMVRLSIRAFCNKVLINLMVITLLSYNISVFIRSQISDDLWGFIIVSIMSVASTICIIYFIGLSKGEREFVNNKIQDITHKIFNR